MQQNGSLADGYSHFADVPSPSQFKHPLKGRGGCSRTAVSHVSCLGSLVGGSTKSGEKVTRGSAPGLLLSLLSRRGSRPAAAAGAALGSGSRPRT